MWKQEKKNKKKGGRGFCENQRKIYRVKEKGPSKGKGKNWGISWLHCIVIQYACTTM